MLLAAVLLSACRSGDDTDEAADTQREDCFLEVYVYAPGRPVTTRADVGEIARRTEAESKVHTLKIWVFRHDTGERVGYLYADPTFLTETTPQKYQIKLNSSFVTNLSPVDVYVVANAESCGVTSLGDGTSRSELDGMMIGNSYFGVTSLTSTVPSTGLPMSAVLRNQPITGKFPTLRIGTDDGMATLQLTRAVSKLRFVICRIWENPEKEESLKKKLISIDKITLNGSVIPTKQYLMPQESYNYTSFGYESTAIEYLATKLDSTNIPDVKDPTLFVFETQEAQDYEDLINNNLITIADINHNKPDNKLLEHGLTYFRESDKQLTGTIEYTVSEKQEDGNWENVTYTVANNSAVSFSMAAPGDFLRNHSWIVYIYFMDTKIHVFTVTNIGVKNWENDENSNHEVYNW